MPNQQHSIFVKYNYPLGFAAIGVIGAGLFNFRTHKPVFSGIHWHFICGSIGGMLGYALDKKLDQRYAARDAQVKHYMEMYPEDFVEHKRKYKDIFDEWIPVR